MAPAKAPTPTEIMRAPFTAAAIRFKIQAGGGTKEQPKKALVICYIDARLVIDRLNLACGLDWHDQYRKVDGGLECALTIGETTRIDVGVAEGNAQGGIKALYSDALKRAAVKFGVGISVYATPQMFCDTGGIRYGYNGKPAGMTDGAIRSLRSQYQAWLDGPGIAAFGKPIDHGDVDMSTGDHETTSYVDPETGEVAPTRTLTPKPADQQQTPYADGNPATGRGARQTAAAPVEPEQAPTTARSPEEIAVDCAVSSGGWLRVLKKDAEGDRVRALISSALVQLAGLDGPQGLPGTWPARMRMAYGFIGDKIATLDGCIEALGEKVVAQTQIGGTA